MLTSTILVVTNLSILVTLFSSNSEPTMLITDTKGIKSYFGSYRIVSPVVISEVYPP